MNIVYHIDNLKLPGGIGRIVSLKANWFAEHGYDVTILTTEGREVVSFYPLAASIKTQALDVNLMEVYKYGRGPLGIVHTIWARLRQNRKHIRKLREYLATHPTDVFFTTINVPGLTRLQDGSKKIIESHFSIDSTRQFMERLPLIVRWIYRIYYKEQQRKLFAYDYYVLLTHKDFVLRHSPKNAVVIPNFITITPPKQMANTEVKSVIAVGRLSVEKGFDFLFQAWHIVSTKHPDWKLNLYSYGYGREQEYCHMIKSMGIENSVTIHEPVKDIVEKYLESAFFVLSSRYEGFPLVIGEAMACGLPCVSYDCNCGPSDIITDHVDGLLVRPTGDVGKLAEAINWMIEHPEERAEMGRKARHNVQRFNTDAVMEQWVKLVNA